VATVERATNLHRAELLTTLRAALPGLWVAVAAFVLALATIVVSLFRQPLDLVVSLAGLVVATSLAIAAILAVGPIRKLAVIAAFAFAAVTPRSSCSRASRCPPWWSFSCSRSQRRAPGAPCAPRSTDPRRRASPAPGSVRAPIRCCWRTRGQAAGPPRGLPWPTRPTDEGSSMSSSAPATISNGVPRELCRAERTCPTGPLSLPHQSGISRERRSPASRGQTCPPKSPHLTDYRLRCYCTASCDRLTEPQDCDDAPTLGGVEPTKFDPQRAGD
jgi:hypothetical protein